MDELLLPERAVLLHVGPHKTGTTAIQSAFRCNRTAMAEYGVVYPHHGGAARAVTGTAGLVGDEPAVMEDWDRLVQQVAEAADQRVAISREAFCVADAPAREHVVAELGGSRVHVVITLRPVAALLPSAWQQYVRNWHRVPYQTWLRRVLKQATWSQPTTSFWRRHHHGVLVENWARLVGPQNVTVIMVDNLRGHELMRPFERLLGLPAGLLQPERDVMNRSFTHGEAELVRYLNRELHRRGWSADMYRDVMYRGVIRALQNRPPDDDEPSICTPGWALDRAAEIGAEAAQRITDAGVRVVGDISTLGKAAPTAHPTAEDTPRLPAAAAADGLAGGLLAAAEREQQLARELDRARQALKPPEPPNPPRPPTGAQRPVYDVRSVELLSVVFDRVRRRLRRNLRRHAPVGY